MGNGHHGLLGHLAVQIVFSSEEESVPIHHQNMEEDTALEKILTVKIVLAEHANVSDHLNYSLVQDLN